MKTKKGFTLVELLAVIIILGVIMTILVPVVKNTIKNSKERAYETTVEAVKVAALSYKNSSEYGKIPEWQGYETTTEVRISELINASFLDIGIKNPKTGKPLRGTVFIYRLSENVIDCVFEEHEEYFDDDEPGIK